MRACASAACRRMGGWWRSPEASDHPFMVGTQFHPEFRSRPNRPHPLFRDFIGAARHVVREGMQPPLPLSTPEMEGEPVEG